VENSAAVELADEKDVAFAVVDIDTLRTGKNNDRKHWKGSVCKVYSTIVNEWKLTMYTRVPEY